MSRKQNLIIALNYNYYTLIPHALQVFPCNCILQQKIKKFPFFKKHFCCRIDLKVVKLI